MLPSASDLKHVTITAMDGDLGRMSDLYFNDRDWAVRYLVIDTEKWWGGKTVLVSPAWLTRVTWDKAKTLFCLVTAAADAAAPRAPSRKLAG